MIKKILYAVLALVLLAGCAKPKSIKPGETVEVSKTQRFYIGVLVVDLPGGEQILKDMTEEQRIDFLVVHYGGKYRVLPEEVQAALLVDTEWITPAGVTVKDPSLTLEPADITWTERESNQETTKTAKGYKLVIRATIVASPDAQSGEVILKMRQFKTMELAGLYVVKILGGEITPGSNPEVVPDSDTYIVAVVE